MFKGFYFAVFLVAASVPNPGYAQADDLPVQYKPVTNIDFGEQKVKATLIGPGNQLISEPRRPVFNPMIWVRADFDELTTDQVNEVK